MKRLLAALLALMMLLTMTSCAAPDAAETDDKLTLVAFNVGKADALLLTSGDTAYLIDTGTEDSWADLSRALEDLGVTHLTGVIVTHMDKDHYGGAKQLAESDIAIDGWYASWAWEKEKWKKHPVVKAAAIRGEEITLLQPGDTLSDGLLTVIGPIQEREESENDNSLVLVASGGGGKMLLTGDMEYDEENDLLAGKSKLAGILVERPAENMAVIGIGINVFNDVSSIAGEIKDPPARLADLVRDCPSLHAVMASLGSHLNQVLSVFSHGGVPSLQEGLSRAWAGERPVSILTDDETVRGIFTGIDDQGNPVLSLPAGTVRTIPAHLINRLLEE